MDAEQKAAADAEVDHWVEVFMEVKATAEAMFADPQIQEAWIKGEAGVMVSAHGVRAIMKPDEPELPGMYL